MFNKTISLVVVAAAALAPGALAQCSDARINSAFQQLRLVPQGSGTSGECDANRYAGGNWNNNQNYLSQLVKASRQCQDPWIGEVYLTEVQRYPQGNGVQGECSTALYGRWNNYPQLVSIIKAQAAKYATPTHTNMLQPINNATEHFSDAIGGCLGVENGNLNPIAGMRIIHWDCKDIQDQKFRWYGPSTNTQVMLFSGQQFRLANSGAPDSLCLDAKGGNTVGAEIISWPCRASTSKWTMSNGQIKSPNGMCVSLWSGFVPGNNNATLQSCGNPKFHQQFSYR